MPPYYNSIQRVSRLVVDSHVYGHNIWYVKDTDAEDLFTLRKLYKIYQYDFLRLKRSFYLIHYHVRKVPKSQPAKPMCWYDNSAFIVDDC